MEVIDSNQRTNLVEKPWSVPCWDFSYPGLLACIDTYGIGAGA
jgi:hypothetical protein